jgi:uncharacterized membrane protein YhaH (DUF805 family)
LNWYLAAFKKYAAFEGRARRKEFWMFVLVNTVIYLALAVLSLGLELNWLTSLALLYTLAVMMPGLAVTVRRLHDTGRSARWYFIAFVPFIGGLWLLALTMMDGEHGDNEFGLDLSPEPKPPVAACAEV